MLYFAKWTRGSKRENAEILSRPWEEGNRSNLAEHPPGPVPEIGNVFSFSFQVGRIVQTSWEEKGQVQFAGTARRVLRTNWTCPLLPHTCLRFGFSFDPRVHFAKYSMSSIKIKVDVRSTQRRVCCWYDGHEKAQIAYETKECIMQVTPVRHFLKMGFYAKFR